MAEYFGPNTDNEAVMISTQRGRIVPDRYSTCDCADGNHTCCGEKLQDNHAKLIHNDIYERFGQDTEPSDPW